MKLSIIIPCYNESKDIAKNAEIVKQYLKDKNIDHELILVNDGSKDNTKEVIESIEGVKAISYEPNRGKGGAVKEGILNATGDYVLFMDADLSTDISAIEKVVELTPEYDLILGSRHAKDSVIKKKQPALRVFIGWCCRQLVNFLFHTHLKDTQCGFKAIRTDVAKKIVEKQRVTNFAFDVEYIYIAKLNKLSMKELGIVWSDDRESTVSPFKSSVKFFNDLGFIRRNKKNYYFSQEDADKDVSKFPIVVMSSLLFLVVLFFVIFLLVRGCANNNAAINVAGEQLNDRFLNIVQKQIQVEGLADDNLKKVNAVTYEDNYPTSFSLNITASSETNVYYYSISNYSYPTNHDNFSDFSSYLLLSNDALTGNTTISYLSKTEDQINTAKNAKYVISKNTSDVKYVSGFYFENNKFNIFIKKEVATGTDPFLATEFTIESGSSLFSYYQYLNQ